ncbi:hypothetical protein ABIE26_004550 [Pedobacter africanus]|uniref:Uncharacterized protein n=1 Tax=Pedobacter africanus TaxID=151894 RepID=A0ACC6L2V4_9SPHI|nr:MAC/perforin domain-containing protein [Pedobacter africanus]MDR6785980.1 hypothetical protein [Pedobacter africanus]
MNKQTKTACLILAFAAILSSCKKNEALNGAEVVGKTTNSLSAGDGQNDLLGYGYDVTGEYANSSAAKYSVIDVVRLKADQPTRVEWDLSSKKYGEVIAGENAFTYLSSLTDKLGSSLTVKDPSDTSKKAIFFKGSIENSFDNSNSFSSKHIYSGYAMKIQQKRVKMNATISMLKQYLTSSFIADVQSGSPQYIVSQYGTHILKDIILGAKLDIKFRAETSKSDRKDAATKGIEFNILGIFGFSTSSNSATQQVAENFSQRLRYEAIGGEPSASLSGNLTIGGGTLPVISTTAWENSSSLLNAEMIDVAENGLIPIWELIDDPAKSAAVKTYVIQYIIDKQLKLTYPDFVVNGRFVRNDDDLKLYMVFDNTLRHIPSMAVLDRLFQFDESLMHHVNFIDVSSAIVGAPISHDSEILTDLVGSKMYFREGNVIRHISTWDVFLKYHFNDVTAREVYGISGYTLGKPIE